MSMLQKIGSASLFFFLIIFALPAFSPADEFNSQNSKDPAIEEHLWNQIIPEYLSRNLWQGKSAYNSCHFLMVPLHHAFHSNDKVKQRQFYDHFSRFVKTGQPSLAEGRLNRLQYLYLASWYLALAAQENDNSFLADGLPALLYQQIHHFWEAEPAWQWSKPPFIGGIRARLEWKLANRKVSKSYYRAIIDEELFLIGIAANVRNYELSEGIVHDVPDEVSDILYFAKRIFRDEGVITPQGGWLFQPGVWKDHPDYAHAGRTHKSADMRPSPAQDITWDSSHSARFPCWFTSLMGAYPSGSPEHDFYKDLRNRLEQQFFARVLHYPDENYPFFRTSNFMDGRNGVYRWEYKGLGPGRGYGPYELSGTLTLGWWSFLDSDRIRAVYREMAEMFPLSPEIIKVYAGATVENSPEKLRRTATAFNKGFRELIVRLAGKLPE